MAHDPDIERELHRIHRTRNRLGYFPNLVSYILSVYFQRDELLLDARWYAAGVLILLGTLLRIVTSEIFFDAWDRKNFWARSAHILGFFTLGAGWALHFADVSHHYGPESINATYTLLVLVAFITGASTSLLAHKESYYTYVLTLTLGVVFTFLTQPDLSHSYIVLNVIVYLFFSVSNYKFSCRQLYELLEMKKFTSSEREKLKNLINTVPGLVGLIDKDLVCYMANQATLKVFPQIVGKKVGDFDHDSLWEKHIIDFMQSNRAVQVFEEKVVYKGSDVYALLNIQKTKDGGATIVSIITTELVETRKQIRVQEAKAQYSAKLASLGEMAAGVAHEVNNPLTIIAGSANIIHRLIDEEPIDKNNLKLLTKKVMDTTERISKTVKSLKSLSRNGENDPKVEVSIEQIVNISVDLCQQKSKMNSIEFKIPDVLPDTIIMGREVQLSQVLVNLLSNSIDAVKNLEEKWIEIKTAIDGGFIDLFVIDSGKGIPKEIQTRIMDPFFTTKDVNQGTGLGLSISKTIMQDHGGELSLMENCSHTTFRLRLPIKRNSF